VIADASPPIQVQLDRKSHLVALIDSITISSN
jgi:hypothetical protein